MTHLVPVIRPVLGTPFRRDSLYRRAGAMPSFHIAPARTQTAADLITGSVLGTYNSATPAMAVGPDGVLYAPAANAPVIEYDPVTLSCLGARVSGVAINQLLRSQEFETASWAKARASITADVIVAPDNTLTADKLVEDTTASNSHTTSQASVTFTSGSLYTFSVFIKAAERTRVRLQMPSAAFGTNVSYNFDLTAVTATVSTSGTNDSGLIIPMPIGNGWYRCALTAQATATSTGTATILLVNSAGTASYTGNGTSGIYLWGAQVNPGLIAPYVPTTSTAASTTADVWDLTNFAAGANNIRSLYARVRTPASGTSGIISLNDNSSSNRIALQTTGTSAKLVAVTSGSTVADITGGTISANTAFSIAARIVGDDYAVSVNGSPVVTDTSGAKAVVDRIFFGRTQAGEYLNGYIEECSGWTQYLTDSQLQAAARS